MDLTMKAEYTSTQRVHVRIDHHAVMCSFCCMHVHILSPDKNGVSGFEPSSSGKARFGAGQTAFFYLTRTQVIF